ncbi:DUF1501 domain-containing protein [Sphingomonas sp. GlSt437]|uniref:DUF1501 domain-containing protein n=2 Tax=Pseudomonadota TaxID=1224 RepID=UPI003A8ACE03
MVFSIGHHLDRRSFLRRLSALGVTGAALPFALEFAAIGEAAAFTVSDYKALVCIFLYGGNDYANTLIPYDLANYDRYSAIRGGGSGRTAGGIALSRASLDATSLRPRSPQTLTNDLQFALAPQLKALKSYWDAGNCAALLNVGPLIVPLTRAQYDSGDAARYPSPSGLFSHNDQQSTWQSLAAEGSTIGWGGRLGDLAAANNGNALLTCVSAGGNAVFVSGETVLQYQIGTDGARPIYATQKDYYGTAQASTVKKLLTQSRANIFENEFNIVTKRSLDLYQSVASAIGSVSLKTPFNPDNDLAAQLAIVAQLIGGRAALGAKRQVFFVSAFGYDTHDGLVSNHPALMADLNEALDQFYRATVELGVSSQVTSFTASDFGRTLASNGDGSDHGWGSHHFILGGAVKGGQYYGVAPEVSLTSDDQVGQGRLLPSTAVDQYAATLASWFGVTASEMSTALPRIGNFSTANLGFMN